MSAAFRSSQLRNCSGWLIPSGRLTSVGDSIAATVWVPCVSRQSSGELATSATLQMQYKVQARKFRFSCKSSTNQNYIYMKKNQIIHHIHANNCAVIKYNNIKTRGNPATCFGIFLPSSGRYLTTNYYNS